MTVASKIAADPRLDGLTVPAGGWPTAARSSALMRLQTMGLPVKRDEYWRYTDPSALVCEAPLPCDPLQTSTPIFGTVDKTRLVFVDGVFDADQSDAPELAGVEITRLFEVNDLDLHWAQGLYGKLEEAGQSPVARPLAALNTAQATEGMLVRVTGKPEKPLHISYRQSSKTSEAILHHVIKVEAGAELTLLETGTPGARSNVVLEVDIADGGTLHHVRPQGRAHGRHVATHLFARVATEATLKSFTLSLNGQLTRNEIVTEIVGDDAAVHVGGACVGDGDAFHHDDTVFITHDAVNCESRQVFKKVLRNGATGVFQGKILVKAGAQKTDGYQISQALLLDGDSQFLAKPELEIYADDVACSHGSTSGAIDEDAMFYLRSRGVPEKEAQNLLVIAFLGEALDEIENEDLAADLQSRLEAWFSRHST
ncbi:Fe-S cluster assembly protein SufD [Litoreibacter ascidiaceicola]|uniref:Fe-S cluster assembly protein SufD n=1 Tax=Litoreibacter ascidiaceicola TaxID=1486859 RepID=A0A1M4VW96_9RHOB|nr:SufD family Fe-S cluster assembly protein [Litoreibacter ascidiaceicola]SHE73281.1 Fe-S cluster assembly protein SufD [Litoreibacter ascidiaceicola]